MDPESGEVEKVEGEAYEAAPQSEAIEEEIVGEGTENPEGEEAFKKKKRPIHHASVPTMNFSLDETWRVPPQSRIPGDARGTDSSPEESPASSTTSSTTTSPSRKYVPPSSRKKTKPSLRSSISSRQEVIDFITLFNSETFKSFKDITVIFGKTIKIKCHGCMISQSSYFQEELRSLGENESEIYVADDIRVHVSEVRYITQWFYGKTPVKGRVEIEPLLSLCRKFQLPLLLRYIYSEFNLSPSESDEKFLRKQSSKNEIFRSTQNRVLSSQENVSLHISSVLFPEIIHPLLSDNYPKFNTTQFCLICRGGEILKAHREVLVVKSPFFHGLLEKNLGLRDWRLHINLKPCLLYLMYLYTGTLNDTEIRNAYAPELMSFEITDFCGVYRLGQDLNERDVVDACTSRITQLLDETSVLRCITNGDVDVIWDRPETEEKARLLLERLLGRESNAFQRMIQGIEKVYEEKKTKIIYERVDRFLFQVKNHSSEKTSILVDLKRELDILESDKRSCSKKRGNYLKALEEQKKRNEELQVMIAKSLHPSKYEKRIKELEKEVQEKGMNKGRAREMEELGGKIKQIERKQKGSREELKKTEESLLKLFNETEDLEKEISKLQRRIELVNENINVVENIAIRSFTQPVFE